MQSYSETNHWESAQNPLAKGSVPQATAPISDTSPESQVSRLSGTSV